MAITIFAVLSAQEIFSYFIQNNQNDKDHELLGSFFALPSQQTPVFCARSAGHFRFLLRERATDNKHCSCLYVCASVCFCFVIARRWFFFCSVGLLFFLTCLCVRVIILSISFRWLSIFVLSPGFVCLWWSCSMNGCAFCFSFVRSSLRCVYFMFCVQNAFM